MKKNVWILNHHATSMFFNKGGRHYWFAKFLKWEGYEPVIFCCNTKHGAYENYFDTDQLWIENIAEEIQVPFVAVKSSLYKGNGKGRVLNMIRFYRNVQQAAVEYAKIHVKPDVIYASSVHPLTLVAGIKLAKHFGVKCICEIRDLWPASLVAYGFLRDDSLLTKVLYKGERWIYREADKIIMTWPGGYQYITDKGWQTDIPADKVVHISNGVDLQEFKNNRERYPYKGDIFHNSSNFNFVYAGSIRKVNNLGILLQAVKLLRDRGIKGFNFTIFGDGNEREALESFVKRENLDNVFFMGRIPKQEIPSVLSQADVNILHNSSTALDKYGQSQNKFFEYLASGKPILMTYSVGYSVVKEQQCGMEIQHQTPEAIADAMLAFCNLGTEKLELYKKNTLRCASQFDFKHLTEKLINVLENI